MLGKLNLSSWRITAAARVFVVMRVLTTTECLIHGNDIIFRPSWAPSVESERPQRLARVATPSAGFEPATDWVSTVKTVLIEEFRNTEIGSLKFPYAQK